MVLKRLFLVIWIFLWVAEPFMALAAPAPKVKSTTCASCGMKNTCGKVCCCLHSDGHEKSTSSVSAPTQQRALGLYAKGCSPADTLDHFFPQDLVKWFHPVTPKVFPAFLSVALVFKDSFLNTSPADIPSPPPESGFLS